VDPNSPFEDFARFLERYAEAGAGRTLGTFHPFTLAIELADHPGHAHARMDRVDEVEREYSGRLAQAIKSMGEQGMAELGAGAVEYLERAAPAVVQSLYKAFGGDETATEAEFKELARELATLLHYRGCEARDPGLKPLKREVLHELVQAFTVIHEQAHLQLSCASPVQAFCNAIHLAQVWCVQRCVALRRQDGIPLRAPLLAGIAPGVQPDHADYPLRLWANAEQALDVLAGRVQGPVVPAAACVGVADRLVVTTLPPFARLPHRGEWQIDAALPGHACPLDPWGRPYGMDAIQEGYATLTADTRTAYTYFDLLEGSENTMYHGIYFALPYHAAQKLGATHPTAFRHTFLTLCDLAMTSHLHPLFNPLQGEFTARWHDLHPGWRFERALDLVARRGDLLVIDCERDYPRVVNDICQEFHWPPPARLIPSWLRLNRAVRADFPLAPVFEKENAIGELRLEMPHLLCTPHGMGKLQPSLTRVGDEGFTEKPSPEVYRIAAMWTAVSLSQQAVTGHRFHPPRLPFREESSVRQLIESAESFLGFSRAELWPDAHART